MKKHDYICKICEVVNSKSTCDKASVGAVFINDDYEILSTGYNGAARGLPHCSEVGHREVDGHCTNSVHAEQNAIVQAAKNGTSLKGSILYVTHSPCEICTKLLINLGIKKIFIKQIYKNNFEEFKTVGVDVQSW